MEIVLFRFIIVWLVLHIILFFIEFYRYKHDDWNWYMLDFTRLILAIDITVIIFTTIMGLGYWILHPIIE